MEDLKEQRRFQELPLSEKEDLEHITEKNEDYTKTLVEAEHFMQCLICCVDFDNNQHAPLGLQCGHTCCSRCIHWDLVSD